MSNKLLVNAIKIARPDYWFKNIFVLPGMLFAVAFFEGPTSGLAIPGLMALTVASFVASSNYIINEYLDAGYDKFHPLKSQRPFAHGGFPLWLAAIEYAIFLGAGLTIAFFMSPQFLTASILFVLSGIAYNIPPLRLKDRTYLDVIAESFNIVLRMVLGWSAVMPDVLPPSSLAFAFWGSGAFIMALKRFAEYRYLGTHNKAVSYRSSFAGYNEQKLLALALFSATLATLFLGVFLVKYKVELILVFPLIAVYFSWYLMIALKDDSVAQTPERLFREGKFVFFTMVLIATIIGLMFVDIKNIAGLLDTRFIAFPW